MVNYADILKHFENDPRRADNALARYYLGYPVDGTPSEWDWSEIIQMFHVPTKTLSLLIAIQLRHTHGVDLESELF